MHTFTITYTVEWTIKNNNSYVWTKCGLCFNLKTGKQINQSYKNGAIGYYINSKFISLKKLRTILVKPTKEKLPF